MDFELWRRWVGIAFLNPNDWEYALFTLGALLSLALLYRSRRNFSGLDGRRAILLVGCLLAPLVAERFLVIEFVDRGLLPPPGIPFVPAPPFASLTAAIPVAVAGAWLGPGPGLLVGLTQGVLRSGAAMGGIADPFHFALYGYLVGLLLHQNYRGRLPAIARQPIVALPVMAPIAALVLLGSSFARVAGSGLSGFDYALGLTSAHLAPLLLESGVAGLSVQAVFALAPRYRPVRSARDSPPYTRTLNRRLLFLFVPLISLMTIILVYAVTTAALRLATSHAVEQMARDATYAADEVPYFVHTGQGLLAEFSRDLDLWGSDGAALESRLRAGIQTVLFFDQLLLFDMDGRQLAAYPPPANGDASLTSQERIVLERGLESGAPQTSTVHRSDAGLVILSFVAPMTRPPAAAGGAEPRVLIGRAQLDINPGIGRILAGLQWPGDRGEGFLVDAEGRIVAHPDPNMLLTEYQSHRAPDPVGSALGGSAYEGRNPRDNTRELIYQLPIDGHPWLVVIRLPYTVVSEQARQIATPLLALQILMGGGLVLVISLATNWLTKPLQQLATAAERIARGDYSRPVEIPGHDEVARVGDAFDEMRVRLKDRMGDLSLLLEVSQAVSATLELSEGMPFILEGVLQAADAQVAHIVFLSGEGEPTMTMSCGEPSRGLQALDEALTRAVRGRDEPVVLENLARARSLLGSEPLPRAIKAIVALPIRTRQRTTAVLWVGYGSLRPIQDAEIDLLSTLAGQTAVLVENARLFETAEGERRRLAATLASTTDAVLVTNQECGVLLINPAGEGALGVEAEQISGRRIERSGLPLTLVNAFTEPLDPGEGLARELTLPDGRTLCASVSAILSADGQRLGRVAVMRDITQLKELNELKSNFVATVSHDLRGPLAFIRGYTTMLSSVGELNEQQLEYVGRILSGVNRMSDLVENLLNLGRIEAGVDLEREPCHLGVVLAETVESMRPRAAERGVALRLEPVDRPVGGSVEAPIVSGDATLLLQAMTNLVDNAIKYTPREGAVTVGLSLKGEGQNRKAVIAVSDTGIGVAPEDQPHVFEKFYRAKRDDAPDAPGTGLGLSLVKSIVGQHGGKVALDSQLNEGSTFYVTLPLANTTPADY